MADSQKYGRTANLFNVNDYIDKSGFYVGSQEIVSSANSLTLLIPCEPNTTYTISRQVILPRYAMAFVTSADIYNGMPIYGYIVDSSGTTITSTSDTDSAYIALFYAKIGGSGSSTPEEIQSCLNTLMVNVGSTALPYEPYLDWQHSLKKYDGTNWIDTAVKEWDGSQWQ